MKSPVYLTHEIIDLSGKLDWHTQRADVDAMEITIKLIRKKITQLKKFIDEHEADNDG